MNTDLEVYTNFIRGVCALRKWKKDWLQGGCYIHLEVSELIEAFRGKGNSLEELGDVLFTLIAVADYYNIDPLEAMKHSIEKHTRLLEKDGLI
jgi:NTP pyrophosphatase (non-canonical NTP hydrolase)